MAAVRKDQKKRFPQNSAFLTLMKIKRSEEGEKQLRLHSGNLFGPRGGECGWWDSGVEWRWGVVGGVLTNQLDSSDSETDGQLLVWRVGGAGGGEQVVKKEPRPGVDVLTAPPALGGGELRPDVLAEWMKGETLQLPGCRAEAQLFLLTLNRR